MSDIDSRVESGLTRLLDSRTDRLASGERHIGWKMAFGAPAMLERFGLTAPVPGYLTTGTVIDNRADIGVADWTGPVAEFELALHLTTDVAGGASPRDARASIGAIGAAIELADVDLPLQTERLGDIIAGNIFHRSVTLGVPDPSRAGGDLSGLVAEIMIGGVERQVSDLEEFTGEYGSVVAAAAAALSRHGVTLRAGDVIIAGSIVPPVPVTGGATCRYQLTGLPPLTVEVSR
jgi:2-keto-4-pentenoate hydratase